MKRMLTILSLALGMAVFAVSQTRAEGLLSGVFNDGAQKGCDDCGGCDECCDDSWGGGLYAEGEVLFFKYMKADGVRAGNFNNVPPSFTDDVSFDFTAVPRLTLGYATAGGLGVRARYFEYDQAGTAIWPATGAAMGVDTYNLDLEVFERVQLNDCWDVEFSAGIRYNEFEEVSLDPIPPALRLTASKGLGGLVGMEARRSLGRWGSLYGRVRGAIMQDDDKLVINIGAGAPPATSPIQAAVLTDVTQGMAELAIGYEISRCTDYGLFFARCGYEWQQWHNYSTHYTLVTSTPFGNPGGSLSGPSDVGFSGFALSLGFEM